MAIAIHWVSALLIVVLLVSGFRADATVDAVGKITILRAHAIMGIMILILTLVRIAWWRLADRKPTTPESSFAFQSRAAQLVHVGAALYHQFIRRDGLLRRMGIRL